MNKDVVSKHLRKCIYQYQLEDIEHNIFHIQLAGHSSVHQWALAVESPEDMQDFPSMVCPLSYADYQSTKIEYITDNAIGDNQANIFRKIKEKCSLIQNNLAIHDSKIKQEEALFQVKKMTPLFLNIKLQVLHCIHSKFFFPFIGGKEEKGR